MVLGGTQWYAAAGLPTSDYRRCGSSPSFVFKSRWCYILLSASGWRFLATSFVPYGVSEFLSCD